MWNISKYFKNRYHRRIKGNNFNENSWSKQTLNLTHSNNLLIIIVRERIDWSNYERDSSNQELASLNFFAKMCAICISILALFKPFISIERESKKWVKKFNFWKKIFRIFYRTLSLDKNYHQFVSCFSRILSCFSRVKIFIHIYYWLELCIRRITNSIALYEKWEIYFLTQ